MRTSTALRTGDIPQADRLVSVRQVLNEIARGNRTVLEVCRATGVSLRHVQYRWQTARILQVVDVEGNVSRAGIALLVTPEGSPKENRIWRRIIGSCPAVKILVGDLFSSEEVPRSSLADRIQGATGLSRATAERRAMVFSSWRRQLLRGEQGR